MITEPCLAHLALKWRERMSRWNPMSISVKSKPHGVDLHRRYGEIRGETAGLSEAENEADLHFAVDFHISLRDMGLVAGSEPRNIWSGGHATGTGGDCPQNRAGSGASNHCAHGKSVSTEVALDWRPFEYSTVDTYEGGKIQRDILSEPLPNGGRVHNYSRIVMPLPALAAAYYCTHSFLNQLKYDQVVANAARLAKERQNRSRMTRLARALSIKAGESRMASLMIGIMLFRSHGRRLGWDWHRSAVLRPLRG